MLEKEDRNAVEVSEKEQLQQQPACSITAFQMPAKPAPWAKNIGSESGGEKSNSGTISNNKFSLMEIQKMEAERVRLEQERETELREKQAQLIRAQEAEVEAKRAQRHSNWAGAAAAIQSGGGNSSSSSGGGSSSCSSNNAGGSAAAAAAVSHKSLAEIQAEEVKAERVRQEKLKNERKARQKEMSLGQASVWGNASTNLNWASKANNNHNNAQQHQQQQQVQLNSVIKAQHGSSFKSQGVGNSSISNSSLNLGSASGRSNNGFWEEQIPSRVGIISSRGAASGLNQGSSCNNGFQQQAAKKSSKGAKKAAREEEKVASMFKDYQESPTNDFEAWVLKALQTFSSAVDAVTFMGFLRDIESPYEVSQS